MTNNEKLELFAEYINTIVGEELITELDKNISGNNLIGGLVYPNEYLTIKNNFTELLKNLLIHFKSDAINLPIIKNKIKELIKPGINWAGAYSELIAYDFWTQFKDLYDISLLNKFNANEGFTEFIDKRQEIDLDVGFTLRTKKIYLDVKSFKSNHDDIFDNVLNSIYKIYDKQLFIIGIEGTNDANYLEIEKYIKDDIKNNEIFNKLKETIDNHKGVYEYNLPNGIKYIFRIVYPDDQAKMMLITENGSNPYRKALNCEYKFIQYYDKILYNSPSLLIFVNNPWFNKNMFNFNNSNSIFYRSVSRRVFINLVNSDKKINDIFPDNFTKDILVSEIAQNISGIIFVDDNSITKTGKDKYNTYIYLNPNAKHKLKWNDFHILSWTSQVLQPDVIEDFEYDNY